MPSIRRASVKFLISADYAGDTSGVEQIMADTLITPFANGTGTSQANRAYQVTTTIAASGTLTITLTSLTDNIGNALVLTKLRALFVSHLSTSVASQVTLGGGTNPLFGTKITGIEILPGDTLPFVCKTGYTIASGSADRIRIVNSDSVNAASVRITILGSQ